MAAPDNKRFFSREALAAKKSITREILKIVKPDDYYGAGGIPPESLLPAEEFHRIMTEMPERGKGLTYETMLKYGQEYGIEDCREQARRLVNMLYGLDGPTEIQHDEIMLAGPGSQSPLFQTPLVFLDDYEGTGDAMVVEAPTYLGEVNIIRNRDFDVGEVTLECDGMNMDEFEYKVESMTKAGKRVKLVYVNPDYQNPSSTVWSEEKRMALLRLADEHDFLIQEDDAYGPLTDPGWTLPPSFMRLDRERGGSRVVHTLTFSKIIGPGLRTSTIVAAPDIINAYGLTVQRTQLGPPPFTLAPLAVFLEQYDMRERIAKLSKHYAEKRAVMADILEKHFPEATFERPHGGMFLWVHNPKGTFPKDWDEFRILDEYRKHHVLVVPGPAFYLTDPDSDAFRLNGIYYPDDGYAEEMVKRLAETARSRRPRQFATA